MGKFKDITGQKFGRLTALYRLYNYHKRDCVYWLCVCDCGNLIEVKGCNLRNGATKSCGCFNKEETSRRSTKHGKCETRMYRIYYNMIQRIYNTNRNEYKHYGGRGIVVCDEWRNDFMSFYNWAMSHGYDDTLTIDRIDVNGNYEPSNCRWVSQKQQVKNRRNNINVTITNKTHCLSEWCKILSLNYNTVKYRIHHNWTIEQALELEAK